MSRICLRCGLPHSHNTLTGAHTSLPAARIEEKNGARKQKRLACILGVAAAILAARATLEYASIHASDIDESDDSGSVSRLVLLSAIVTRRRSYPALYQDDEDSDVDEHPRSVVSRKRKRKRSKSTSGPSSKDGGRRKSRRISLDEALPKLEDVTQRVPRMR